MGNDIMKIINNLNNNIDGINNSLKTILDPNGGVVIHDTFAPITTKVTAITTLGTTIVGAIIGTMFTMWLFKRQEKMRIKEELKLDFIRKYMDLYKVFIDDLQKFASSLNVIKNISELDEEALKVNKVTNKNGKIKLDYSKQKYFLENAIDLSVNVQKKMTTIYDYIKSNKIIMSEYKGNSYDKTYWEMSLIHTTIDSLKYDYMHIDSINRTNESIDEIDEVLKMNDKNINEILATGDKIKTIIKDIGNINSDMEKEFIGKYFK